MSKKTFLVAAAGILALSSTSNAQALATFGSAEIAGFGEGSALIGTSLSTGRQGLGPVASVTAQTYRYRSGLNAHSQAYAVSPSLGLQYSMPGSAVQGSLGYTFVNTDVPATLVGLESGPKNGAFVSGQYNYWGEGENTAQAIANYGLASEYYWTRLRAAHRLAPSATPVYVGAELVFQGTQKDNADVSRYQVGPTIEYRVTPSFRLGGSAGYRGGNNNAAGSGYARIEFLHLTRFGGM